DARPPEATEGVATEVDDAPAVAGIVIPVEGGDPITLNVSPPDRKEQRLVVVSHGGLEHRDRINTDKSVSRERFIKKAAAKLDMDKSALAKLLEDHLTKLADQAEQDQAGKSEV